MKLKSAIFVVLLLLFIANACAAASSTASDDFSALLNELAAEDVIQAGGTVYSLEDHTDEWARIDWYQWRTFGRAGNFVFSANVSWASAHERPNTESAGCGIVFRAADTSNLLTASLNMDGYAHLGGYSSGTPLYYPYYKYGSAQIKGTHQFVVAANGPVITVYVDGEQVGRWSSAAITGEGFIGLATMSGTNKGFGTRCEWTDIYYYTWN